MTDNLVSLHDKRVVFDGDGEGEELPEKPIAGLRFTARFSGDRERNVDLTSYPIKGVAAAAATILWEETQPGGALKSPGSLTVMSQSLWRLAEFLAAYHRGKSIGSVRDILPSDVDELENYLRKRFGATSRMPWTILQGLRHFLELALRHGHAEETIRPRLAFVSNGGKGKLTPRDAYSPFIAQQIRDGAMADIKAVVERIAVKGAAFVAAGNRAALGPRSGAVHGDSLSAHRN